MSWQVYDRIRLLANRAGIYTQEKLYQDQSLLDRVISSGEFLDFSQQQSLLDQTNLQINRLERYKDYDQMDEMGEISLALDLYADESSLTDPEVKHVLVIKAKENKVKEELENLFYNQLLIDSIVRPMVRYLCKYGDSPFEIITNNNRDGIASLRFINVYNFTRVETKFGDLVGFFHQDETAGEPDFLHPWQVMHLRLTDFGNLYHPYGKAIIEGGRKSFKQLRLMEDAALIYRITRAPEKRVFKIPVGDIASKEVPEFMQGVAKIFKNQKFYDPTTGKFNERYSPIIQEDDFFLPVRPDGSSPSIDIMKGAENLDQIADIEYFKKKMIAPTKIPFSRVGIGDGAGDGNEKSLASSDSQFAKAVQWVQREISIGLTKVAICHLALKGYTIDDIKSFQISMSATNAIDELYRMETWKSRSGVMGDLRELGWFPKEWIVTRFTDLTPDEIQELDKIMENEKKQQNEKESEALSALGGLGGGLDGDFDVDGLEDGAGEELPGFEGEEQGVEDDIDSLIDSITNTNKSLIYESNKKYDIDVNNNSINDFLNKIDNKSISTIAQYIIDSNELDGLSSNDGKNILCESSVDENIKDECIKEYKNCLEIKYNSE